MNVKSVWKVNEDTIAINKRSKLTLTAEEADIAVNLVYGEERYKQNIVYIIVSNSNGTTRKYIYNYIYDVVERWE